MAEKISSFKRPGRLGQRYRKQINGRRYEIFLTGNREQREHDYKIWVEKLERENKSRRVDGSKTWAFFTSAFLKALRTEKDAKTGKPTWRTRTIAEYSYALAHFEKIAKPHYVRDLTFEDIALFRRTKAAEAQRNGDDNYGVNKDMGCLLRAFDWGMVEGYIPYIDLTPLRNSPKKTSAPVVRVLTTWELAMLLKYSSPQMRVAVRMGFEGNLRPEEMYNFLIEKLDPKTGIAWISHNAENKNRGIRAWTVKRDKERPVYFTPDTVADILSLHAKTYLLTNENGHPLDDSTFSKHWNKNLKNVNEMILRKEENGHKIVCTYKSLRKTHTSYMIQAGAAEIDVSKYVSHADKKTTERHYIDKETLRKADAKARLEHLEQMKSFVLKLPQMVQK